MKLKDIIWLCQLYHEDDEVRKEIDSLIDGNDIDGFADVYYSNDCIFPFLPITQTDYMPHVVIKTKRKDGTIEINQRHCIRLMKQKKKSRKGLSQKSLIMMIG